MVTQQTALRWGRMQRVLFGTVVTVCLAVLGLTGPAAAQVGVTSVTAPGGVTSLTATTTTLPTTGSIPITITGSGFDPTLSDKNAAPGTVPYQCYVNLGNVNGQSCTTVTVTFTPMPGAATSSIQKQLYLPNAGTVSANTIVLNIPHNAAGGNFPAGDWFKSAGTLSFMVGLQSPPGGNYTVPQTITINPPAPSLTATNNLNPTTISAGQSTQAGVFVNGNNISVDTQIWWDHQPVKSGGITQTTSTYFQTGNWPAQCSQLPCASISIPTSYFVAPGYHTISLYNAPFNGIGGGESGTAQMTVVAPIPGITSLSPNSASVGRATPLTVTVTGTGFVPGASITFGSNTYASPDVLYVSSTSLQLTLPPSEFTTTRSNILVSATNPAPCTGGSGGGCTGSAVNAFNITQQTPVLSSILPTSATAGSGNVTINVTGSSFDSSAVATWDGAALATTYFTPGSLQATIPAANLAQPGQHLVGVSNVALGTVSQNTLGFTVNNPVPALTSLSPPSTSVGSPVTVSVNGSGYTSTSTVTWGGMQKAATLISANQLQVALTASDVSGAGTVHVVVNNPAPGGGNSAAVDFTITNPAPSITTFTPTSALAGGAGFSLTVNGLNFVTGSYVTWNGANIGGTVAGNGTTLTATVAASRIATAGTATIGVYTPSPGGGTVTAPASFTIVLGASIQLGTLSGTGPQVSVPVSWTGNTPDSGSLSCGNGQPAITNVAGGTCTYTASGTYTISGTYVMGGQVFVAGNKTVTVVSVTGSLANFASQINGANATGTVLVYSLPVPLTLTMTYNFPVTVGITDALDLTRSRVSVTPSGLGAQLYSLQTTGGDAINTQYGFASGVSLAAANSYTVTLSGYTLSGAAVNQTVNFTLAYNAVTLTVGAPAGMGVVTIPVTWPALGLSNMVTDCGTTPTQTFTGAAGTCQYAAGGSFSIRGTFTDPAGNPNLATVAAPVTIPWQPLATSGLTALVNGTTATQVYSLPAVLTVPLTIGPQAVVGAYDPLDLASAKIQLTLPNATVSPLQISSLGGTGYTATSPLSAAGTYTVALSARSRSGQSITTTPVTFTLAVTTVNLTVGTPTGKGIVTVAVTWPSDLGVSNMVTDCGTTPATGFTGGNGTCLYTKGGPFTIRGTFTDVNGTNNVPTAPASVSIPWQPLTATPMVPQINGGASTLVYSLPAALAVPITFTPGATDGAYDALDIVNSKLIVSPPLGQPVTVSLGNPAGQTYTPTSALAVAGEYTLTLSARTLSGQSVSANAANFTLSVSSVPLVVGSPAQAAPGAPVTVAVQWSASPTVTAMVVDCGTSPKQTFTGASGQCAYTTPGSYTIGGTFTDPAGTVNVTTPTTSVTVPTLGLQFASGTSFAPTIAGTPVSGTVAVYSSPVPVAFPVRLEALAGIGFADTLDLTNSSVQVTKNGIPGTPLPLVAQGGLAYQTQANFPADGAYAFYLSTRTRTGQTLQATSSVTLTTTTLALTADPLVQQTANTAVAATVRWPAGAVVTNMLTDCGTVPAQTFVGSTGTCVYTAAGSYSVKGTFTDPLGMAGVSTGILSLAVPALVPTGTPLLILVNGQPATQAQVYNFPAQVEIQAALAQPTGIGILDTLDLATSSIGVNVGGAPQAPLPLTRTGTLAYTASTGLTTSGAYAFTLQGVTKAGQAVTASGTLQLTLTPLSLSQGTLTQQTGWTVAVPISWPASPLVTDMVTDCGTVPAQTFPGASAACVYSQAKAYTVQGSFTDPAGVPNTHTAPLAVTVPVLGLTQPTFIPMLGGQPAAGLVFYALPSDLSLPLSFVAADGVGVPDALDLSATRILVSKDGGTVSARIPILALDTLAYRGTFTPNAFGDYTFTLDGHSKAGAAVTATATLALRQTAAALTADDLIQAGAGVTAPLHWPPALATQSPVIDCGVRGTPPVSGPDPVCAYTRTGNYQVTGTFVDPNGTKMLALAPLTLKIPGAVPIVGGFKLTLNGLPATNAAVSTTLPTTFGVAITLVPSATVGVLDAVSPQTATVTVTKSQTTPVTVNLGLDATGLTMTGQAMLNAAGDYQATFTARTKSNTPLTATASMSLSGGPIGLAIGAPVQRTSKSIQVPVSFPDGLLGTKYLIDCGTRPTQILAGQSVACVYATPGTYQAVGSFLPDGAVVRVSSETATVLVPGTVPTYLAVGVNFLNAGEQWQPTGSTPDHPIYHLTPITYPVDMKATIAVPPPADPNTVSLPAPFDGKAGRLTLTLLDAGDGTPVPSTATANLPIQFDQSSGTYAILTSLKGFILDGLTPHLSGTYALTFTGKLQDGTPVAQTATIEIDQPLVSGVILPYGLTGPYAQASYQYRATNIASKVKHERIGLLWTATGTDASGNPVAIKTTKGSTAFSFNLAAPGVYTVSLRITGSASGSYLWSEQILVPETPDASQPLIQVNSGGAQRPPIQYTLKASLPPLPNGDRYTTLTWYLDGQLIPRPNNRPIIKTAGTHVFSLVAQTVSGAQITGSLSVYVHENMVPTGTIDCSKTVVSAVAPLLRCTGTGLDPDGRVVTRRWVIPELNIDTKTGWSIKASPQGTIPPEVTVHLYVTDNSGGTTDLACPAGTQDCPGVKVKLTP